MHLHEVTTSTLLGRVQRRFWHLSVIAVLIVSATGFGASARAEESPFLSPCLEIPESVSWVRDSVLGSEARPELGAVTIVDLEEGVARRLPTFGPIEIGAGPPDFHATGMSSLLVDSMVGLVAGSKKITVRSTGFGDGYDPNIARELEAIARSVGVTDLNGNTTGPFRRVIVAMPIGGVEKLRQSRSWIRAGLRSGRMLTVAATGNEHLTKVSRPAAFPEAVAVGGSSPSGAVWSEPDNKAGSNVGSETDVLAPGCQVVVALDPQDIPADKVSGPGKQRQFPDRRLPTGYYVVNGTSEATMVAAAVAARIWSANPSMHAVQVKRALERSGGEAHSNSRGFGIVNLAGVPIDRSVPTVRLVANRTTLALTIRDNTAPVLKGDDGVPGQYPESGIAAVAYATTTNGPWTVVESEVQGAAFFDRSPKCQNICALPIPAGVSTMIVRAMDSGEWSRLGGSWTGVEGTFGEATWRLVGPARPTTSAAPTPSKPTTTTSRESSLASTTTVVDQAVESPEYRAYRQSFGEFVPLLESAIDEVRVVAPPDRPIEGKVTSFAGSVQPSVNRICTVTDAITARSWKSPVRPPSMTNPWKVQFWCIANLTGSEFGYANTFGQKSTPIGDHPCYRKFFATWETNLATLKAFVAGAVVPPPAAFSGC